MRAALAQRRAGSGGDSFHIYVAPASGNDTTGTGSKAAPYATDAKAISVASTGQSIGTLAGSTQRVNALAPAISRLRMGKWGVGADPVLSGGVLVTTWTQGLSGGGAPVQRIVSTGPAAGTSFPVHPSAGTTAGDALIASVKGSGGIYPSGVSDSKNGAWTLAAKSTNVSGATIAVYYVNAAVALLTTDTITITTPSSISPQIEISEWSGFLSSPIDVSAQGNVASGTTCATAATSATATANELVFSAVGAGGSGAFTPPTGYTERTTGQTNLDTAYLQVTATGTQQATWGIPPGAAAAVVVTFKTAAPTGTGIWSGALTKSPSFVTSAASGVITGLNPPRTTGTVTTATNVGANQWFWTSNTLYVNLSGTNPNTVTIDAAVNQIFQPANGGDYLTLRHREFHHGWDRGVHIPQAQGILIDRCTFKYDGYVANSGSLSINDGTLRGTAPSRVTRCTFDSLLNDGLWYSNQRNLQVDNNNQTNIGYLPSDVQSDGVQVFANSAGNNCNGLWFHHNNIASNPNTPKGCIIVNDGGVGTATGIIEHNVCTGGNYGVEPNASGLIVRDNTFINQVSTFGGGIHFDVAATSLDSVQVYRNLVVGSNRHGLVIQSTSNPRTNFVIANNTFVDCAFSYLSIQSPFSGTVENNIAWWTVGAPTNYLWRLNSVASGGTVTWDYNLAPVDANLGALGLSWLASVYTTMAAWKTASSQGAHTVQGDPLLSTDGLYTPGAGSPALNAGTAISGVTDPYGSAIPIGYVA